MMIPWAAIGQLVLGLINLLVKKHERKQALKKQMYEFIKKHDAQAQENTKLRAKYDELLKKLQDQ